MKRSVQLYHLGCSLFVCSRVSVHTCGMKCSLSRRMILVLNASLMKESLVNQAELSLG